MPTLIVKAKTSLGRSRAGQRFTREPSIVDVTDEQEASIRADSFLVVIEPKPAPAVVAEVVTPIPAPKAKR